MKKILLTLLLLPTLAHAAVFSPASSHKAQKLHCDANGCVWLEWNLTSVQSNGTQTLVSGVATTSYSEDEERRKSGERLVDEQRVDVLATCSLNTPSIALDGTLAQISGNKPDTPTRLYFHLCHDVAPTTKKVQDLLDKNYK